MSRYLNSRNERRFMCPICNKRGFKHPKHVAYHFNDKRHEAFCKSCNLQFYELSSFFQHCENHQGLEELPVETGNQPATEAPSSHNEISPTGTLEIASGHIHPGSGMACAPALGDKHEIPALNPDAPEIQDSSTLLSRLLGSCHSPDRLRTEGYHLEYPAYQPLGSPMPCVSNVPLEQFLRAPKPGDSTFGTKRAAIAIACERVQTKDHRQMLAFISVIDFFSDEVLMNNFVAPEEEVHNWLTSSTGLSHPLMDKACHEGDAFMSWQAARQKLGEFMDSNTILVGHKLERDLNVLGLIHGKVVDPVIITPDARCGSATKGRLPRKWGLKPLCRQLLQRWLRESEAGYSTLEHARTARDLVKLCLEDPDALNAWAEKNRPKDDVPASDSGKGE